MREIKFKALHVNVRQFFTGLPAYGLDGEVSMIHWEHDCYVDIVPKTLCQYTGLKDKNGTEVYESDIITCGPRKYKVTWNDKQGEYYGEMIDTCDSNYIEWAKCEVIGNIHTNPELLEAAK